MSRQSREAERLDAIRSVSLEDIVMERHTRWRRFLRKAKSGLTVVSLVGLTAAAGAAAYFVWSGPGEYMKGQRVELAAEPAAPVHTGSLPETATAVPLPTQSRSVSETQPSATGESGDTPQPERVARLPNPRPDSTGSEAAAGRPAHAQPQPRYHYVERRRFRPCRALQRLTAYIPLPQVRCSR